MNETVYSVLYYFSLGALFVWALIQAEKVSKDKDQ